MKKALVFVLLSFVMAGCVSQQQRPAATPQPVRESPLAAAQRKSAEAEVYHQRLRERAQSEDCGKYPSNYQALVKAAAGEALKDPQSAMYKFEGEPKRAYKVIGKLQDENVIFGYGGRVQINAKNSYGGYVGFKLWTYVIRDGKVIDLAGPF